MQIHVVSAGETIESIAQSYGVTAEQIIADNQLSTPVRLVTGQTLVILFPAVTHIVSAGESLYDIAQQYGTTPKRLMQNNFSLHGLANLYPGQRIVISYEGEKLGTAHVNSYAYPFIQQWILQSALPYLTYLTPFTYGFRPNGSLVGLDDAHLISEAHRLDVRPLMHLSTLTEEGGFSNELANYILNNAQARETLLQNVLQTMREKGYTGLDVDFEYIPAEDAPKYAEFIREATALLNPAGYEVIVALAPKTSATQRGLLYEGHDYAQIGAAANAVLLMTYEWGYTYGPPMAVAPINRVREVVEYAVTVIPRDKLYLGVPNYGYDWTLPFVQGDRAQSISNVFAVTTALNYGAVIQYDEQAQTPFFNYFDAQGREHEVWFEDARSIRAKLELLAEYGMLGAGYWNAMRPFPQNYLVLNALYDIV